MTTSEATVPAPRPISIQASLKLAIGFPGGSDYQLPAERDAFIGAAISSMSLDVHRVTAMTCLRALLLALLVTGCGATQPTDGLTPAERGSLLRSPSGPGASRTTVGELLEPARAGAPAASPDVPRGLN